MRRLNRMECRDRLKNPRKYIDVFASSFREAVKSKTEIEISREYDIWEKDFWDLMEDIAIDIEIGKERQQQKFQMKVYYKNI